jgi:ABC-2 type transport system ATP-binding protein
LDEPTAGLDPQQIFEFRQLIQKMDTGQMLIISSHILSEIAAVSSRVLVLKDGMVAADSSTANIGDISNGGTLLDATISGDSRLVSKLIGGLSGVVSVEKNTSDEAGCMDYHITMEEGADIRKSLFQVLADNSYPLMELKIRKPTLEDYFIRLTSDIRG